MLAQPQAFSLSHASLPASRLRLGKRLGGAAARTADPSWPRGNPLQHCAHQDKLGEGGRREGRSEWWCVSSRVTVVCDKALLSWRCLNTCLPMGSWEWIPYFALLARAAFALPVKWSLSQLTSFLNFCLSDALPHPTGEDEQTQLPSRVNPQYQGIICRVLFSPESNLTIAHASTGRVWILPCNCFGAYCDAR